ncbi:hypothetical protein M405DRAFT_928689 [Rhizopogon salebrosus TDB-379]|nr:hypothetical protein M405DRAFT_928689 [Rhizopogon salebrosus TDB-379]
MSAATEASESSISLVVPDPDTAPSPEDLISTQSNSSTTTHGNSARPPSTGTGDLSVACPGSWNTCDSIHTCHTIAPASEALVSAQPDSATSNSNSLRPPSTGTDRFLEDFRSPTLNIRSAGASGANGPTLVVSDTGSVDYSVEQIIVS